MARRLDPLPAAPNTTATYERLRVAAAAALELEQRKARERFAAGPWPFFAERVRLIDPLAAPGHQIAPYPDFPYCRHLVDEVHGASQLIIWKARRMIVSWTVLIYFVWRAAHLQNQRLYVVSRVEGDTAGEGARELIWRAGWIVANLADGPKIRLKESRLQLEFPDTGSTITGMGGSEPNKLRSIAANALFLDEFGFYDQAEALYGAARPTIEGRGKVIIACTTTDGFFKELVYDESGSWMEPNFREREKSKTAIDTVQYVDGMEAWTNRGNGFRVLTLDFWADPRKQRGTDWETQERKGMPERQWRREMLREFNVHAGRPVFLHEWDAKRMIVDPMDAESLRYRTLIVSLDFGYNRPAATVSTFMAAKVWRVLRAHLGNQIHFTAFMQQVLTLLAEWFPGHEGTVLWCCDQAGKHQGSDAEPEIEQMKKRWRLRPKSKYSKIPPTVDRMRDYMTETFRGLPCFQVERHPSTRIVIDALNGGYRYPEATPGEAEPDVPEKDGFYEHIMDTLRYTALNFGSGRQQPERADLVKLATRDIVQPRHYILP